MMNLSSFGMFAGALAVIVGLQMSTADAAKDNYKVVYSFCSQAKCKDGSTPYANLIVVNGTLYGTTLVGGANCISLGGCGTVFSLDPKTGAEKVVYSFCNQQNCTDGSGLESGLLNVNGTLYGTTVVGGSNDDGVVFSLDPATGVETVVHSFGSGTDGIYPYNLIDVNETLYGTTSNGGSVGFGTLFSIDLATGTEAVLYSFGANQNDGENPLAGLVALHHTLYGTTSAGGAYGGGTVFGYDLSTGAEALYSFCLQPAACFNGDYPIAGLTDEKGTLYGTTLLGGIHDGGTVFSVNPATLAETVVHSFTNNESGSRDGAHPWAALLDVKGTLYGTTYRSGNCKKFGFCGTVFSLDPASGAEKVLHHFGIGAGGSNPAASLLSANGALYGTTLYGGAHGYGAVFEVTP